MDEEGRDRSGERRLAPSSLLAWVAVVVAVVVIGLTIARATELVRSPFALEYREYAQLDSTMLLMAGGNPFVEEALPTHLQAYGILYPAVMAPVSSLLGVSYAVHRAVSVLCALAAMGLVAWIAGRPGRLSSWATLAAVMAMLSNVWLMSYTTTARPDNLGMLLFWVAVALGLVRRRPMLALVGAALAALLAGLAKPYFVLAAPVVVVHLFLVGRRRESVLFAVGFGALLGVTALFVNLFLPRYAMSTLTLQAASVDLSVAWLGSQLSELMVLVAPLPLLLLALLGVAWRGKQLTLPQDDRSRLCVAGALVCLPTSAYLSLNFGASMIYLFQLAVPWLVLALVRAERAFDVPKGLPAMAIRSLGLMAAAWSAAFLLPSPGSDAALKTLVASVVSSSPKALVGPLIAGVLPGDPRVEVVDNGLTGYLYLLLWTQPEVLDERLQARVRDHQRRLVESLREHRYSVVYCDQVDTSPDLFGSALRREVEKHHVRHPDKDIIVPVYFSQWRSRWTWGVGIVRQQAWVPRQGADSTTTR